MIDQLAAAHVGLRISANELGQRRARHVDGLLGLRDLGLRGSQFRLHSRFVGAGAQLRRHQSMNRPEQDLPTLHRCTRGLRGLLRGDHGQEGVGGGHGDVVPGAVHARLGMLAHRRGGRNVGGAQTKIERLPGDQNAQAAVPHRAEIVRWHAVHAGNDALRKQQPIERIARGAIHLRQAIHARQVSGLRQANSGCGRIHLLLRHADRRIVPQSVFHRLGDAQRRLPRSGLRLQVGRNRQKQKETNRRARVSSFAFDQLPE